MTRKAVLFQLLEPKELLYCDLNGTVRSVPIGKRSGYHVPMFAPGDFDPTGSRDDETHQLSFDELLEAVSGNLTPKERRTWHRILKGASICQVAREDGVSRAAVYERIRGNSKKGGGMVVKNPFVAIWWIRRQEKNP